MSKKWIPTLEEIAGAFAEHESVYKGVDPTDAKKAFWRSMMAFLACSRTQQCDILNAPLQKFKNAAERQKEYSHDKD